MAENEIWSESRLFEHIKAHGMKIPANAYCTKDFCWSSLIVNQHDIPTLAVLVNLRKIANTIQKYKITVFKNAKITITSGWRSPAYNRKIGGAANSYHTKGLALDFVVQGMPPQTVQKILNSVHFGGLEFAPTWTHIDLRDYKARFDSSGKVVKS